MLNSGRQEPVEMACRGMRLPTHARSTAVNKDMLYTLWQMQKKKPQTPVGIFKVAMSYSEYDLNRVNT